MTRADLILKLTTQADQAEQIGALAPVAAVLRAVVAELADVDGLPAARREPNRLLTLAEAAERLHVPRRWLSDHRDECAPFLRTLTPGGTVRVDEAALMKWLATRPAAR